MVADGTYVFCEKSQNYKLQKELYSMHKYRHLIKPFVVCTRDGLILDVFGPYSAKSNDANILMSILIFRIYRINCSQTIILFSIEDFEIESMSKKKKYNSFLECRHVQMDNCLFYKQI